MRRPPRTVRDGVRDGRQPFLVIVGLLALVGAAGLIGPGFRSNAIEAAWGVGYAAAWYVLLLGFALYTIGAVYVPRNLLRAVQFERIGMYGIGYTCLAYVPAAIAATGLPGLTAAGMFLGFAFATGIRIRHIHVDLALLDELAPDDAPAVDPPAVGDPRGGP